MQEYRNSAHDADIIALSINTALPLRKIRTQIDRLDISADAKALFMDIAGLTVKVGQTVLNIGRKILSVAFDIIQKFPKTTFGVVIAFFVTALVATVPVVGGVLVSFCPSSGFLAPMVA